MAIPEFDSVSGLLPPGIHNATIEEIKKKLVYNKVREKIFDGLCRLITDLKSIGCSIIYIDGSFVSEKPLPSDVDVCWEMETDPKRRSVQLQKAKSSPGLFIRKIGKIQYCADLFPANMKEADSGLLFLDFFQREKYTNKRKGILKLKI